MANEHLGLFDKPPSRGEIRRALALILLLCVAFLGLLLVSNLRVGEIAAFVPVVDAVVIVGELIIAMLLYGQVSVFPSRALTLLASTFVFIALLLAGHALTFPGAFAPGGLFSPGLNSTAWIMIFRRSAFPLGVILYAFLKEADPRADQDPEQRRPQVLAWVSAAIGLAVAASVLAIRRDDLLPPIFSNRSDAILFNLLVYNLSNIALVITAMTVLFLKRRSVLDLWLQVALAGWLVQALLNLPVHARFTLGWYCLFLVVLFSHLCVLLALIAESNRLYARLALSTAAQERERDARLLSVDAVAAAISHEVGQPLAAMSLSAKASLNCLTRAHPNPEKAIQSLHDTISAGKRTFEVIRSVRAMFRNDSGTLSEFGLNELVRETASLLAREFAAHKISLQLALDEALPPVNANRVQLQRVLVNLLTNAIEAVDEPGRQARRISIRSMSPDTEHVLLEISDSGAGIAPEQMAQIFDPFYTTKSTGTGLGLSLSRSILEEHRGRLWASNGDEHGAVLHLQLPSSSQLATRH